jgi:hypothetical protein
MKSNADLIYRAILASLALLVIVQVLHNSGVYDEENFIFNFLYFIDASDRRLVLWER